MRVPDVLGVAASLRTRVITTHNQQNSTMRIPAMLRYANGNGVIVPRGSEQRVKMGGLKLFTDQNKARINACVESFRIGNPIDYKAHLRA